MLVDDVITRLEAQVSDLAGRVQGAAELTALVREGALPNETPFAFVLPLGLSGGEVQSSTGVFIQSVQDTIAIILLVEGAGDVSGEDTLPEMKVLIDATLQALCGWGPASNNFGVFRVTRGALVSLNAGTQIYQLDFAIDDQIRI